MANYRFVARRAWEYYITHEYGVGYPNMEYEGDISACYGHEYIKLCPPVRNQEEFIRFWSEVYNWDAQGSSDAYMQSLLNIYRPPVKRKYGGKEKVSDRLNRERVQKVALSGVDILRVRPGVNTMLIRVMDLQGI